MDPIRTFIGTEDAYSFMWFLWHTQRSFLAGSFEQVLSTAMLYYPHGVSLRFDAPILQSLWSIPVAICCGPIAGYNFVASVSFILTFVGTYLFLRRLTNHRYAALAGAAAWTFSSYRLYRLSVGHLNLLGTEWISFFLFFGLRMFSGERTVFFAILSALTLGLQLYTDYRTWFMVVVVMMAFVPICVWQSVSRKRAGLLKPVTIVVFLGVSCVLTLPFILWHGSDWSLTHQANAFQSNKPLEYQSADLLDFVLPREKKAGFLGWFTLALTGVYLSNRKKKPTAVRFAAAVFILGTVLAIGNVIKINDRVLLTSEALPYPLLANLPFFRLLRAPARFALIQHLSLTVLFTYAVADISTRKQGWFGRFALIGVVVMQSVAVNPVTVVRYSVDPIAETVHRQPSGSVLTIPYQNYSYAMFHQIWHGKPLIGGYVSYADDNLVRWYEGQTPLQAIVTCQRHEICPVPDEVTGRELRQRYGIRYVIVYEAETRFAHVLPYVRGLFPGSRETRSDGAVLFELTEKI